MSNTSNACQVSDWDLIVATMNYTGVASRALDGNAFLAAAAEGDGYGKMSAQDLTRRGLAYDWSHVRDSSPEAIKAIANSIRNSLGPKALEGVAIYIAENNGNASR